MTTEKKSKQDVDVWWSNLSPYEQEEQKIQYEMELEDTMGDWWNNLSVVQREEVRNNLLIGKPW